MIKKYIATAAIASLGAVAMAAPAAAEMELSFYGGYQTAPHSRVKGTRANGTAYSNLIGWDGKSFEAPPYYGMRAMWWRDSGLGFGMEFTHSKFYAPGAEMPAGFSRLEFTDGHNIITANVMKRWDNKWGKFTPYVGAGIGFAMPHVDVTENGNRTFGYQVTGPAAKAIAGVKYDLNDRWGLFSEYQFTISQNEADLENGGTMKTRLISNALNFGVSYSF